MSIFRHIDRFVGAVLSRMDEDERDSRPDHVSQSVLRHHQRHQDTRGVDLPTWRTPREIERLRRAERRAALRLAKGA